MGNKSDIADVGARMKDADLQDNVNRITLIMKDQLTT